MERTFVIIKPDALRRKLIGEIITRIERRNFSIVAMKMLTPSKELAEQHYVVHKGKEFFDPLVQFVMSGPVVAMVVEGENAIKLMRNTMGATSPEQAAPGTIRGDLTISLQENLIHGSDSLDTANMEIDLWFPELKG
ncbi:MAG: nucleoside-diphosphate kinase [Armatimonadetes bacterium]|nr:nucleoside-diphosphate kinase [Armatimonadota bacterium]